MSAPDPQVYVEEPPSASPVAQTQVPPMTGGPPSGKGGMAPPGMAPPMAGNISEAGKGKGSVMSAGAAPPMGPGSGKGVGPPSPGGMAAAASPQCHAKSVTFGETTIPSPTAGKGKPAAPAFNPEGPPPQRLSSPAAENGPPKGMMSKGSGKDGMGKDGSYGVAPMGPMSNGPFPSPQSKGYSMDSKGPFGATPQKGPFFNGSKGDQFSSKNGGYSMDKGGKGYLQQQTPPWQGGKGNFQSGGKGGFQSGGKGGFQSGAKGGFQSGGKGGFQGGGKGGFPQGGKKGGGASEAPKREPDPSATENFDPENLDQMTKLDGVWSLKFGKVDKMVHFFGSEKKMKFITPGQEKEFNVKLYNKNGKICDSKWLNNGYSLDSLDYDAGECVWKNDKGEEIKWTYVSAHEVADGAVAGA